VDHIIVGGSADSKYLAPSLSVKTDSSYISNVVGLPTSLDPFKLKRSTYSNKAFSDVIINNSKKLIGIYNNSFGIVEKKSNPELISLNVKVPDSLLQTDSVEYGSGNISIADADIVVSAGRGLKGPENWNIIEDLAKTLGAATACSKPVSDMGWRPHGEHVGQTGKPVATNLYIAIGISGAIQHLAGVSSSKVKVVINSDPEAPFFKAADYGIVGDAFDIIPRLNEKLKAFKASSN
jgi:electron transfer flavoprotein alpha subunit